MPRNEWEREDLEAAQRTREAAEELERRRAAAREAEQVTERDVTPEES